MSRVLLGVGMMAVVACSPGEDVPDSSTLVSEMVQPASFDGADYSTRDGMIASERDAAIAYVRVLA